MIEQRENHVVTEAEVRAVANELNLQFPESLVEFLVNYNGGEPTHPLVHTEDGVPLDNIMWFIPIHDVRFQRAVERFPDLLARGLFPLADNGAGDYWFIELETGLIRIWQHEIHVWENDVSKMPAIVRNLDVLVTQLAERKPAVRRGRSNLSPFAQVAKTGSADDAAELTGGKHIDAEDGEGFSLLELAALEGNQAVVQYCLEQGAQLRQAPTNASIGGHVSILQLFLQHGWDINARDPEGRRAIDVVVSMEVRRFLYENGSVRPSSKG